MEILRSDAKSWYQNNEFAYGPGNAYDGDYTTWYKSKDGDAEGNFLKLYLSGKHKIDTVKLTNEKRNCCEGRIVGTVVMVYLTDDGEERKVADCGEVISGKLHQLLK